MAWRLVTCGIQRNLVVNGSSRSFMHKRRETAYAVRLSSTHEKFLPVPPRLLLHRQHAFTTTHMTSSCRVQGDVSAQASVVSYRSLVRSLEDPQSGPRRRVFGGFAHEAWDGCTKASDFYRWQDIAKEHAYLWYNRKTVEPSQRKTA